MLFLKTTKSLPFARAFPSAAAFQRSTILRPGGSTIRQQASSSFSNNNIDSSLETFDVIVVGGGHAGAEAAAAAARVGAKTALITQRFDTIGEMSCNPSMGGIGKGHLIREIDALDGLMGRVSDAAGIHYRVLNRRKGPAVRGPRAQMDRDLYKREMQRVLMREEIYANGITLIEASVQDLLLDELQNKNSDNNIITTSSNHVLGRTSETLQEEMARNRREHHRARIGGVVVQDDKNKSSRSILAKKVIITTGTFLRGVLLLGRDRYSGGRHLRDSEKVEPPSVGLAKTLERFRFPLGRLKTGTPPRLNADTIDWNACVIQPSENPAEPFGHILQFRNEQPPLVRAGTLVDCYQTSTNDKTHELVMKYRHLLPTYDAMEGAGNGPRYCPSIFKKVQRFPDRLSHNCFLEPEGLQTNLVYPNGMSGPYPHEIQTEIMRTMPGLENVELIRPGYDVEYDFVNPQFVLTHALETKQIDGLYLAGQICGTTGYEEAAAQGIIAGANAGRAATTNNHYKPFVLGRDEGYIGVLIDDLVTRGTMEPYRMFTSRAEYRITLRADNADLRLTEKGVEYGLVRDEERMAAVQARQAMLEDSVARLQSFQLKVTDWAKHGGQQLMGGASMDRKFGVKKTAEQVLRMPHVTLKNVEQVMKVVCEEQEQATEANNGRQETTASLVNGGHKKENTREDHGNHSSFIPTPPAVFDTVEASVKYQVYVDRQEKDMASWRRAQGLRIPPNIVYDHALLPTLSKEELEKLDRVRPTTFAEASQISGMTPQSLVYLYHLVAKKQQKQSRKKHSESAVKKNTKTTAPFASL